MRLVRTISLLALVSLVGVLPAVASTSGPVYFLKWGVRTVISGKVHKQFVMGKSFQHCTTAPLVRITANYDWSRLKNGTAATLTWYQGANKLGAGTARRHGTRVFKSVLTDTKPTGFPDGVYKTIVRVNGKALANSSLRVTSKTC